MKMPTQQIQEIIAREMTREEFLKFAGASLLGIIGVGTLIRNLQLLQNKTLKSGRGYGSNLYGG